MISKIAPIFPIVIWMGFIIVILSVVIGFFNSQTAAAYFTESKAVRETTFYPGSPWGEKSRAASQIELRSDCFADLNETTGFEEYNYP